ncbi:MAG TPA: phosphatase PAP2 family protein [Thermoanaerobaculia bacterium]|nr:phosphatase PAP2 family protein [Thermoanaerobaculia bacterium]
MRTFVAALCFTAALSPTLCAQSPDSRTPSTILKPYAHQVVKDAKDLATAPLRWRQHEWLRFAEGSAVVLAAYTADDQIVRFVSRQQNHVLNDYLRGVTHFGGGYGLDLAALLAAGGYFKHDDTMMDAGLDALESSFAAAGIVTPAIKTVVGRARPIHGLGKHSFHPFDKTYQSFPSGHATNAFAIATAIATRYENNRYVPAIAYTLATSVAIARVHDRVHFASDVLAAGMIGHAIAKSITLNHHRARVALVPTLDGFRAHITF